MENVDIHRLHFAFTIIYHYIFPQLSMGLTLLILILKTMGLRGDRAGSDGARFWCRILGLTFVMGVITGIPMEFQFGTNWSRFSEAAGGVIGQTLAMEGIFAFFLESTFLYLLLFQEKRLGVRIHWFVSLLVFLGTWLSGYFIVCTNAWMQHPVGHTISETGKIELESVWALLTNAWAIPQYLHTMVGTTITGSFVMASIGSFYVLRNKHLVVAKRFLSLSVIVACVASVLAAFPTGDMQAKLVHNHQPETFAAMEGHFHTSNGAPLVLMGQPNMETLHLDNPIELPNMLSVLTHLRWDSEVKGLTSYPQDRWPTNVPALYYAYHIMAGVGSIFIAVSLLGIISMLQGKLYSRRWLLWTYMLLLPFPFIANTAGWATAELGRQPWIIYNVMRTVDGHSMHVSGGNALFSLLGFAGLYVVLSVLFFFIAVRIITDGPDGESSLSDVSAAPKDAPSQAQGAIL